MRQEVALARAKNTAVVRPQAHQAVHRAALRLRRDVLGAYLVGLAFMALGAVVAAFDGPAHGVLAIGVLAGLFVGEAVSGRRSR